MPSEAELSLIVGFFVVTAVLGTALLGVLYLFGKTAASFALVVGIGFLGLFFVTRTRAQVATRVQVAERSVIAQPMTDVTVSTPHTVATTSPTSPPQHEIEHIIETKTANSASMLSERLIELPWWMKNPPHEGTLGAGYCKYVMTSQRFATAEEAEKELNKQLAVDVQQSLIVGGSPAVDWSPTAEDLRMCGLVKEKVIETVPMKVGEFDTSVQLVSWLVEFTPASRQEILARWQPFEAQKRSKWILSALAAVSATFGVSAFALRRKQAQPTPMTRQMV